MIKTGIKLVLAFVVLYLLGGLFKWLFKTLGGVLGVFVMIPLIWGSAVLSFNIVTSGIQQIAAAINLPAIMTQVNPVPMLSPATAPTEQPAPVTAPPPVEVVPEAPVVPVVPVPEPVVVAPEVVQAPPAAPAPEPTVNPQWICPIVGVGGC